MGYLKSQASDEFSRWSECYDRSILQWLLFGPSHRALIRRIRSISADRPIDVLDVGCGTGVFARRIRTCLPNARVWGVDLVAGMLRQGLDRWSIAGDPTSPVQGDSERLPFASSSFDIVTCANSFHHYPDQERAVREMSRVLKPGGKLLLLDGFRDRPWGWLIFDCFVASFEGDVKHASRRRFRELFEQAGLGQVRQTVHNPPAPVVLNEGTVPVIPRPHHVLFRDRTRERVGSAGQGS